MNAAVLRGGYVGLTTRACLAFLEHGVSYLVALYEPHLRRGQ